MLDHVSGQLKYYGIDDVVYAAAYLSDQIERRAAKYSGIKTRVRVESQTLGTAGCVKAALKCLSDDFFVISGDCLNDVDLRAMAKYHFNSGADVTMATVEREDTRKYGVVSVDNGVVRSIIEKPSTNAYGNTVNAGIYIINKRIFDEFKTNELDFAKDVFPVLISQGRVRAYHHEGFWSDVGAIEDYYKANFTLPAQGLFPPLKLKRDEPSLIIKSSVISTSAKVFGSVSRSIVGEKAVIGDGVKISDCVVLPGSKVLRDFNYGIIGKDFEVNLLPAPFSVGFSTDSVKQFNNF
jgi:NDP-sugar pyrophosphorylase family protein